jgi:putative hydrolase of the HAD superfamily
MPGIRLYIFDMGGVVSANNDAIPGIAAHLGVTPEELYRLAGEHIPLLMTGRMSPAAFWERLGAAVGREVGEDLFARYFHPTLDREVVALAGELKRDARVVVGTNTIETHYRIHRDLGHYDLFDRVYASHRLGLAKPDPRFYRAILDAERGKPGLTAFIDDLPENVEAAGALGMHAFLFTGAGELRRRLGLPGRSGR